MSELDAEAERRGLAERRADAKLGFRTHAIVYVLVNAGLLAINLVTSPHVLWFYWPLLGWGVGLAAHGAAVYLPRSGLRERMLAAEMDRLRRERDGGR